MRGALPSHSAVGRLTSADFFSAETQLGEETRQRRKPVQRVYESTGGKTFERVNETSRKREEKGEVHRERG